uniref:RNA-directed DNA polymerase, eukaryota, reverse transcriptase zinc-binding domain protein n=1 Tax=Tanacetum cinerariifolium TaxID=118510 RepID=A0A6L2N327_TANCI|nr:RNA-directed DNA polymerase, eukaryota, reverse transcriptase zinc-binding domain protein [Tanacetum cinerariifolium]
MVMILIVKGRSGDSLWVRVIQAIHGVDGRIGRVVNVGYTSIWCDIIKEMDRLASHGIDLITFKFKQTSLSSSLRKMPRSGIESEQWDYLLDSLEEVMLNPSEDRWSCDLNGSGEFLVALARRYIDNNRLPDISSKQDGLKSAY